MITTVPNPVLSAKAKEVKKIDKKVLSIIEDMKHALLAADNPKGVGLAAPQISIPLRIFITKPTDKSPIRVFINPVILEKSDKKEPILRLDGKDKRLQKEKRLEGCLSIPNIWGYLKRSIEVKLQYMDINGETTTEIFKDFQATIAQHEVDHLNGILFTQRVLEQKENLYRIEEDDNGEEKLVPVEL
jgi:peptide deformylase